MPAAPTAVIVDESARPERRGGAGGGAIALLFFGNAALILLLWLRATGSQPVNSSADELNQIGRLTALLGTYLVLWQLLFMSRVPWLERSLGMETLMGLHRWNGYAALTLLLAHAVTQTMGYASTAKVSFVAQLVDFAQHYDGLLAAMVALVLLVAVTVLSIAIVRRHMAYETWYFVHLYAYLAVLLAFGHELATGSDFLGNPVFVWYWWAMYGAVGACLLFYRLVAPLRLYARHRFRVERVEREGNKAVSLYVGGRDLAAFAFEPGQFAVWRFLDGRRWWEAHPFTLSLPPNGKHLRLTVKRSGDFTTAMSSVRVGTPVLLEGPFGRFTSTTTTREKALLIAGGIGITPLRVLAEDLARDGVDVRLLYRARRSADVALRDELDRLSSEHGVRVDYLLSDRDTQGRRGGDWLRAQNLGRLVPDLIEREVYLCGPIGMMDAVRAALRQLEVPYRHIHTEVFRF
ncbi:MAG: ferric reductase-like transmembrane domain-containing protein [Chloroflexota bacterium]|nr:ferric reductase-like transmembrane domain-containing protein [Chloroflexota bacterium]MDE3193539.1 ferric reductase-like transmembrane domain-containing protein [Chloroflexota bacterium]